MVSSLGGVGEAARRGVASISPKVLVQEYLLLVSESWQLAAWRFNAVILFSHVEKPPGVKEGGAAAQGQQGCSGVGAPGARSSKTVLGVLVVHHNPAVISRVFLHRWLESADIEAEPNLGLLIFLMQFSCAARIASRELM